MIKKEITIQLDSGLDTRPVALLVQVASQFRSDIHLESGIARVNAKSIMGMMSLEPAADEVIIISADGADEAEAVSELEGFLVENTAV